MSPLRDVSCRGLRAARFLVIGRQNGVEFIDDEGWIPSVDASVESSGVDLNRRHQMHRT
jgi:hypothetical protein